MSVSTIEWTDRTWNPVRGCTRVSEGCTRCYAERLSARELPGLKSPTTNEPFARMTKGGPRWTGAVEFLPHKLAEPLGWRKPARIFVNSMSDLFHEALSFEEIAAVFGVMAAAPRHTFQVLTKRPERAAEWFRWLDSRDPDGHPPWTCAREADWRVEPLSPEAAEEAFRDAPMWPLPNLVLGTSVEDQPTADLRIPEILRCPAAVHFVSYEPALAAVDFTHIRERRFPTEPHIRESWIDALAGKRYHYRPADALSTEGYYQNDFPRLDWIVAGGESGPGARPPQAEWFRSVRDQCLEAGVPFFFKQWGKWAPYDQLPEETKRDLDASGAQLYTDPAPIRPLGLGKKRTGRELDGELWDQFPKEVRP